jgi:hypothetical protein
MDQTPPAQKPGPLPLARYGVIALVVLSLLFGGWGLWQVVASTQGTLPSAAQSREQQRRIDELEQRAATLARSDQISRDANRDLQGTLAERDEEIAGLRADVAFYERFVGATAQRRGLAVHELKVEPQTDQAWHFTVTLTQNLNRGAVNAGRLLVSVEGTRHGKLQRLGWSDLRQRAGEPGLPYSFKYFQQVEGDLVLPPDFQPVRVAVRLTPQSGPAVEQSFTWAAATGKIGAASAASLN